MSKSHAFHQVYRSFLRNTSIFHLPIDTSVARRSVRGKRESVHGRSVSTTRMTREKPRNSVLLFTLS